MHDHRRPFGAKAHIELHTIALLRARNERGEAVLMGRLVVGSAMREEERALECLAGVTDRARPTAQEAAPAAGSVIVKVVPTPEIEVTVMSPP